MAAQHQNGAKASPDNGNVVMLSGRYRLHCDRRLPGLDSPQAEAFEAIDATKADSRVFALVCRKGATPRRDLISRLLGLKRSGMVLPLNAGLVDWPASGGRHLALILSRPGGRRLAPLGVLTTGSMAPRNIVRQILRPLAACLSDLSERMVPHRAIRADNLFFLDEGESGVVLGECVSAPPGFDQPAIYEPVHHAMCQPEGRGFGAMSDDFYALGVTIALLLIGRNPFEGQTDAQVVAAKLRHGSFSAWLSDGPVPLELIEPLRGLLCDDAKQRWELADLRSWLDGRRLSPKAAGLPPKASRPFAFKGADHWDARSLAHALAQDWPAAIETMHQGLISDWMERALTAPKAGGKHPASAKAKASQQHGEGTGSDDIRLAQTLITLDPQAPLRLESLAVHIEGLGQFLASNLHDTGRVQQLTKLLRSGLAEKWLDSQETTRPEHHALRNEIERAMGFLSNPQLGYGLERLLYRLNPECPCKSGYFAEDYVGSLSELLRALDRLAARGTTARDPMDRHIAAFCLARAERLPEQAMRDLGAGLGTSRTLAMLRIIGTIQADVGPETLPALAQWFGQLCQAKIEEFRHRALRQELSQELASIVAQGNLKKMAALFDDQQLLLSDQQAFAAAQTAFRQTSAQIEWLEKGGMTGRDSIRRTSRQVAGLVSAMLSGMMLIAMTLVYML